MIRTFPILMVLTLAGCGNSQSEHYQQAIAGRWVGEVADDKGAKRASELEFNRVTSKDTSKTLSYNGRVKIITVTREATAGQNGEMIILEGKYVIDGKKLTITLQSLGKERVLEYTITELDDDYLVLRNEKKDELVYKKKN